jgi:hypothetical protein
MEKTKIGNLAPDLTFGRFLVTARHAPLRVASLAVGEPDVSPSLPSHVRGVRQGNTARRVRRSQGIRPVGDGAIGSARRSTGIAARSHEPIDPDMPNLSPP